MDNPNNLTLLERRVGYFVETMREVFNVFIKEQFSYDSLRTTMIFAILFIVILAFFSYNKRKSHKIKYRPSECTENGSAPLPIAEEAVVEIVLDEDESSGEVESIWLRGPVDYLPPELHNTVPSDDVRQRFNALDSVILQYKERGLVPEGWLQISHKEALQLTNPGFVLRSLLVYGYE